MRRKKIYLLLYVVLAWLLTNLVFFYSNRVAVSEESENIMAGFSIIDIYRNKKFYIVLIAAFIVIFIFSKYGNLIIDLVYKYRYLICLLTFILCVCFEINGSSIGMWSKYLGGTDSGLLVGTSRSVRSDEWFVSTPMALSQYHNPDGAFSYFSRILRGTQTDCFLEYGQPVMSIASIFRPFYWGYLFLSAGKGLAFFWCGRFIALLLVSFEMGMLITKDKKLLSFVYAVLMAFSPVVQWWFAVNGLMEMLIYSQLSILMFHQFLKTENSLKRAIYAAVIYICAGGFILTLYPAWMVPIAWILLGLIIWTLWEYKGKWHLAKKDVLILGLEGLFFGGILVYIFKTSSGTISALMNTVYPGKRFETGGGQLQNLTNYVSEIWYPILGNGTMANASESAQFIDFFPLCYIIPFIVIIRDRIKDKLLIVLLIVSVFLESYIICGFIPVLAKVTLLSYSTAHRAQEVVGFCNILLLIRSISVLKERLHGILAGIVSLLLGLICVLQNFSVYSSFYENIYMIVITVLVITICFFCLLRCDSSREYKPIVAIITVVMLCAGLLVNPIRLGVKNITENENILQIQEVVEQDPQAVWAVEGLGVPMNNVGIMAGAPTINSTNIYPNLENWEKLDQGKNIDIYNRYAHILINLKESGEATFELMTTADYFQVDLTVDQLRTLGVSYILTCKDLTEYPDTNISLVKEWGSYRVYCIS